MADQAMFFDQALEDNVQRVVRGMDAQCLETKQHFEDERDARIDLLDAMYQDLLAKFLADTEVKSSTIIFSTWRTGSEVIEDFCLVMQQSSSKFKDLYAAMEHKKREEDLVSVATHGSATHNSWKVWVVLLGSSNALPSSTHHYPLPILLQTELDNKMRHTLQAEQQARALEAQLDSLLLNELDESTVSEGLIRRSPAFLQVNS